MNYRIPAYHPQNPHPKLQFPSTTQGSINVVGKTHHGSVWSWQTFARAFWFPHSSICRNSRLFLSLFFLLSFSLVSLHLQHTVCQSRCGLSNALLCCIQHSNHSPLCKLYVRAHCLFNKSNWFIQNIHRSIR